MSVVASVTEKPEGLLLQKQREIAQKNQKLDKVVRERSRRVGVFAARILKEYDRAILDAQLSVQWETLYRWQSGEIQTPQQSSLTSVLQFLRLKQSSWEEYLEGKIGIQDFWERRGEIKKEYLGGAITPKQVVQDFITLNFSEQLETLLDVTATIKGEILNRELANEISTPQTPLSLKKAIDTIVDGLIGLAQIEQEPEPVLEPPKLLELSAVARERLKKLVELSNVYRGQTLQSLIDSGVDPALLESIIDNNGNAFTEDTYSTLLPHLCNPIGWVNNAPSLENSLFTGGVERLVSELEQS